MSDNRLILTNGNPATGAGIQQKHATHGERPPMANTDPVTAKAFVYNVMFTFVALLVIVACIILLHNIRNTDIIYENNGTSNQKLTMQLFSTAIKQDCSTTETHCMSKDDCTSMCLNINYDCLHGICKKMPLLIDTPHAGCDASKGMLLYYVANTALGTFSPICKSIDEGIAISNDINRMCSNGNININYSIRQPQIEDCTCNENTHAVLVPATINVREYVVCSPLDPELIQ